MSNIKIEITLSNIGLLAEAYQKGEISLNIKKLAEDLQCSRTTIYKKINGIKPKTVRNRKSSLESYRGTLISLLNDNDRTFNYISHFYNYMVREYNIECTRTTFNRFIRKDEQINSYFNKNKNNKFTVRFETEAGKQVQFDMKENMKLKTIYGDVYTIYIATLTFSFSRFNYRKLIIDTSTDSLIAFLAEAFDYVGGTTKELIIDNLKQFVDLARKSTEDKAIINKKLAQFASDYDIEVKPCMPRRPQTKGKTETQNKIVDQLLNYNGSFTSLEHIHEVFNKINDEDNSSISQATGLPRIFLLEKEKDSLSLLPTKSIREKYYLELDEVNVNNDCLFTYKSNKYSVPKAFMNKKVMIKVIRNQLHVYYNNKIIARHYITDKKINKLDEHNLHYDNTTIENQTNSEVIIEELKEIIYDNDK